MIEVIRQISQWWLSKLALLERRTQNHFCTGSIRVAKYHNIYISLWTKTECFITRIPLTRKTGSDSNGNCDRCTKVRYVHLVHTRNNKYSHFLCIISGRCTYMAWIFDNKFSYREGLKKGSFSSFSSNEGAKPFQII